MAALVVASDSSDSAMLFSGDEMQELRSRKGKRQRLSSGGRSAPIRLLMTVILTLIHFLLAISYLPYFIN